MNAVKGISKVHGAELGEVALTFEKSYSLLIYDFNSQQTKSYLFGHTNKINSISTCPSLPFIAGTASDDSTAKIWDCLDFLEKDFFFLKKVKNITGRANSQTACIVTLKGNLPTSSLELASVSSVPYCFTCSLYEPVVKVWDLRIHQCLYELSLGGNVCDSVHWNETTQSLVCGTQQVTPNLRKSQLNTRYSHQQTVLNQRRLTNYFQKDFKLDTNSLLKFTFDGGASSTELEATTKEVQVNKPTRELRSRKRKVHPEYQEMQEEEEYQEEEQQVQFRSTRQRRKSSQVPSLTDKVNEAQTDNGTTKK